MSRRSALLGAAVAVALVLIPRLHSGPRPSPSALSDLSSTAPFGLDRTESQRANRGVPPVPLPPPPPPVTTTTAAPPTTVPPRRTPPSTQPAPVRRRAVVVPGGDVWARLRGCESGGNYAANTGNGYYGAYQFSLQTWRSLGLSGYPSAAAPSVQDQAAQTLQARAGWGQWPACSRKLGLR